MEGYIEVINAYMVNHDSMFGTGQYPKLRKILLNWAIAITSIPAEVPFNKLLPWWNPDGKDCQSTSLLWVHHSVPEAGSAGRDTVGLIRLHQFHKVEMVKFTKPEEFLRRIENDS